MLVVAAYTVGVKFDDRSTEVALEIAKALDLPFIAMASEHYFKNLQKRVKREKAVKHQQIVSVSTDDEDALIEKIHEADLVLIPRWVRKIALRPTLNTYLTSFCADLIAR